MNGPPGALPVLIGCGILEREVAFLAGKNGWALRTRLFDPVLHCDLDALERALRSGLVAETGSSLLVFYGACHPRMERIVEEAGAARMEGQNCIEMLLGRRRFLAELENGAYFLLEEWSRSWERMLATTFGPDMDVVRDIFRGDRSRLLAIETPCSGDFRKEAQAAAELVGLPLEWTKVGLEHLEEGLGKALRRAKGELL
jgi:hypothetical protein